MILAIYIRPVIICTSFSPCMVNQGQHPHAPSLHFSPRGSDFPWILRLPLLLLSILLLRSDRSSGHFLRKNNTEKSIGGLYRFEACMILASNAVTSLTCVKSACARSVLPLILQRLESIMFRRFSNASWRSILLFNVTFPPIIIVEKVSQLIF